MVEVRQMYNCEHALRRAHSDGDVGWLLHIDSDEMFHIDSLDVRPHFARLQTTGCASYLYPIHEVNCPRAARQTVAK